MHKMNIYSLTFLTSRLIRVAFMVIFNNLRHLDSIVLHKNYEKEKVFEKGLTNA